MPRKKAEPKVEDAAGVTAETTVTKPVSKKSDETVPGGRYLVNGKWVDANGKPL